MVGSGKILVWGAGGHAVSAVDVLELCGFEVVGFIDDLNADAKGRSVLGGRVLGGREEIDSVRRSGVDQLYVAFGNNAKRVEACAFAADRGFRLPNLVHPRAIVSPRAALGRGIFLDAGVIVAAEARIGDFVVIFSGTTVSHESVLGRGALLSAGVHLGGATHVGEESFLGIGSITRDKIRIGRSVVVGAGSVVVDDVPDGVLVYGVPAKIVKRGAA